MAAYQELLNDINDLAARVQELRDALEEASVVLHYLVCGTECDPYCKKIKTVLFQTQKPLDIVKRNEYISTRKAANNE